MTYKEFIERYKALTIEKENLAFKLKNQESSIERELLLKEYDKVLSEMHSFEAAITARESQLANLVFSGLNSLEDNIGIIESQRSELVIYDLLFMHKNRKDYIKIAESYSGW